MSFFKSLFGRKSAKAQSRSSMPEEMQGMIIGLFSCPNGCEDRGAILWMRSDAPVCDKCGADLTMVMDAETLMEFGKNRK